MHATRSAADPAARPPTAEPLHFADATDDPVLGGIVRAAAAGLGCPIAMLSLVDGQRQWSIAQFGSAPTPSPRALSFCARAIEGEQLFEVPDARLDVRFAALPMVSDAPQLRFYAGMPLALGGQRIGTLCVLDRQPRHLDERQRALLRELGLAAAQRLLECGAQRARGDGEAYRSSLFEQRSKGVLVLDRHHRILDVNAHAETMLGHDRAALLQMDLPAVLAGSDESSIATAVAALTADASPVSEWAFVRRDGSRFEAEMTLRQLDGARYLAVVFDISERRARQQQLQQLSLAVEQSSESIVITGLDARIEYVNRAAIDSSGYSRAELIGSHTRMLQSGKTPAATFQTLWERLAAGKPWKGLLFNRRQDGREYVEFAGITPIRAPDGAVTHYIAVKEDVTEKKRMGEELDRHRHQLEDLVAQRTAELAQATRAAEAANEAKSAFLAAMSHEIRTPMNGVVGIVDVLAQSSLSPYQADLADTIRESAFALLGIIDDILDFSKIEAGRLVLEREPVPLLRKVERVCDNLQPLAAARGVRLQVFVDPRLPDQITGDALRLGQILNNLVGNAIKFSAGLEWPGRVRVRVEPAHEGWLRLCVGDNGIGMSPEVQARIFDPFVQAEESTTRRYGGTGLGLTICRRLVELFGGSIAVASAPGEGTMISVSLPLAAATTAADAPAHDLSGLDCRVMLHDRALARDWCAYLAAAGARAQEGPDLAWLRQPADAPAGAPPVWIVNDDDTPLTPGGPAGGPQRPRRVRIERGTRRGAALVGIGEASLGGDATHRDDLLHAVALAAGRAAPPSDAAAAAPPAPVQEPPDADLAAAQGRLVLVAEDNDINRKVIRRQLTLLGVAADLAEDGLLALEQWRSGRYGLLLTDLHMPHMDGYELVAAIRGTETPGRRLPIVALSADALHDAAARCRAAGMDDYLSKPVQLQQLGEVLKRWLPSAPETAAAAPAAPAAAQDTPTLPVYDSSVLAALIGDDAALLAEFRSDYLVSAQLDIEALRDAAAGGDWAAAGGFAHRLKSSSRAVGALALGEACAQLEAAAQTGKAEPVRALVAGCEAAWALLSARLLAAEAPVAAAPAAVDEAAAAASGVLLVDDEVTQLEVLQRQLDTIGVGPVQVFCAGLPALQWLRGRDSSALLLLLDLNMPGMDGVQFMRHLADQGYAGTLALISGADPRVLQTAAKLALAYKLNMLDHLPKPTPLTKLRALVERWRAFLPAQARRVASTYSPQEVQRAIDGGELLLHYQPKVSLSNGALVGVEALVRWQHPVDGLRYPGSFVAVAERHGLIDALTRAVLTSALAQARRWRDAGLSLRVAVNISMDNLAQLDFPEHLVDEVARHGLSPPDLALEVAESRLMRDARAPLDILTRLRMKRFGLSIDDFGSGHSSLAQLRDYPFDELKIDRGFVHGSREHPAQRAIFGVSLEMAHQLGMTAVAEGVENQADWDFVRSAGCDMAQGYFVARPMPAEALADWAVQWRHRFESLP